MVRFGGFYVIDKNVATWYLYAASNAFSMPQKNTQYDPSKLNIMVVCNRSTAKNRTEFTPEFAQIFVLRSLFCPFKHFQKFWIEYATHLPGYK